MPTAANYGEAVAGSFGLQAPPKIIARINAASRIAITRLQLGPAQFGHSPVIPPEDSFVAAIYLDDLPHHELFRRGMPPIRQGYRKGALRIVNLADECSANISCPHGSVVFHLPRQALRDFAQESGLRCPAHLDCEPGTLDPVVQATVQALLPALDHPDDISPLYADHVALAVTAHLVAQYGAGQTQRIQSRSGLSPRQIARVEAFVRARLHDDISLDALASQAGLSRGHFTRAFRQSFGIAPYRWVLQLKIELVQRLIREGRASLSEIAGDAGFADQSHMTRTFARLVGTSPARWRAERRT